MPGWHSRLSVWLLISRFLSSSSTLGSVLMVWSLLEILSLLLSAPPSVCSLKINKLKKRKWLILFILQTMPHLFEAWLTWNRYINMVIIHLLEFWLLNIICVLKQLKFLRILKLLQWITQCLQVKAYTLHPYANFSYLYLEFIFSYLMPTLPNPNREWITKKRNMTAECHISAVT